ncbi:MAG TPA: universal stress protein [Longimicrobiales bacterium]
MSEILVPLDGTAHATVALPVAQTLARLLDGTLHVLHVAKRTVPPQQLLATLGLTPEAVRGTVLDAATGSPAEAIVRAAREAEDATIVLCTHTGMEKPTGTLGHVADEVLRTTLQPLVLVQPERGHRPWVVDHILLPHDGTPATASGLKPAARLARRARAELLVLHVAEPGGGQPPEPGTFTTPRYVDQPQHEWPSWATEFLERAGQMGGLPEDLTLRLQVATGDPGAEIVRTARERGTDLIVLAWHGHHEAARARTMKTVIHDAPCPVFVCRVPGPASDSAHSSKPETT